MKILIVRTSSLGDLIQSLPVLSDLHARFPHVSVDWVVEDSFAPMMQAHPLVRKVIAIPMRDLKKKPFSMTLWKKFWQSIQELRKERYDCVFDLQGNCKSGLWTYLSKSSAKVGFALRVCREWPNALTTNIRFFVPKEMNIQMQYLSILHQYFGGPVDMPLGGLPFRIEKTEQDWVDAIVSQQKGDLRVMVCPGAQWKNKQLCPKTWGALLNRCAERYSVSFLLIWGSLEEREACEQIHALCPQSSVLDRRLSIPVWQCLMHAMDLVMAVDSSALHLCGTTKTPSFSVFGPTAADVFKPPGKRHVAVQGPCPYGREFPKQCPLLRSCPTGACMKELSVDMLFQGYSTSFPARVFKTL